MQQEFPKKRQHRKVDVQQTIANANRIQELKAEGLAPKCDRRAVDCYLPTAEEIRMACQEYQATWSDYERYRRAGGMEQVDGSNSFQQNGGRPYYTIPQVTVGY